MERSLRLLVLINISMFCNIPVAKAEVPFDFHSPYEYGVTFTAGGSGSYYQESPYHIGASQYCVDLNAPNNGGYSITAIADGQVVEIGNATLAGANRSDYKTVYHNDVAIEHADGHFSLYMHLRSNNVSLGQSVYQGEIIGVEGDVGVDANEGDGVGDHLHFCIFDSSANSIKPSPMDGITLEDDPESLNIGYTSGYSVTSLNQESTCTPTTSAYTLHLITAEPNGTTDFTLNGYTAHGSGNDTTLSGIGSVRANTGSVASDFSWLSGDVTGDGYDDVVEITDTGAHTYAQVYTSNGIGGINDRTQWRYTDPNVTQAFLADMNADGKADLVLGFTNSDSTMTWKYYLSDGTQFGSATTWSSSFGKVSDIFLIGDFNHNHKGELLRGRETDGTTGHNFTSALIWKRLDTAGSSSTVLSNFGYSADSYLVNDVNSDGYDDLVRIDQADNTVTPYIAMYNTSTNTFNTPSMYANDVGGTDGQYYAYPIDYVDPYPDLIRYNGSDLLLAQSVSTGFEEQADQTTLLTGMASSATFLFGTFGVVTTIDEDTCPAISAVTDTGNGSDEWLSDPYPDLLLYFPSLGGLYSRYNASGTGLTTYQALWTNSWFTQNDHEYWYQSVVCDVDGDGMDEWVTYRPTGDILVNDNSMDTYSGSTTTWATNFGVSTESTTLYQPHCGDYNGDRYEDILLVGSNGNYYVAYSTGTALEVTSDWFGGCDCGAQAAQDTTYTTLGGDFNGDGLEDIVLHDWTTGSWYTGLSTTAWFTLSQWYGPGFGGVGAVPLTGDVNGDGLTDIVSVNLGSNQWLVTFSNGSTFNDQRLWLQDDDITETDQLFLVDLNADGYDDAIRSDPYTGSWWVGLNTGSAFAPMTLWLSSFGSPSARVFWPQLQ